MSLNQHSIITHKSNDVTINETKDDNYPDLSVLVVNWWQKVDKSQPFLLQFILL